jgi:triphosphatase
MKQEIELKLTLPDGAAKVRPAKLRRLLGAHSALRAQLLETTYFDSADGWLRRQGMALRVRHIGERRIQTLKVPSPGPEGLQSYAEFEQEIVGDRPVLSAIADQKLRRRFQRNGLMARLRPLFTTKFERTILLAQLDRSEIEVAIDHGHIACRAGETPIDEIEFELKAGQASDLFRCAEKLIEEVPGRVGFLTKAARGYQLALGIAPKPVRAVPLELARKATAGEAFEAIVQNCLEQLRGNEAPVLASEDDEAIHQFRVAIRRLRAAIGAYREFIDDGAHASLSIDLRWLQRQFGPARDLDVLIADTLKPMQGRLQGQTAIGPLVELAEAARVEARHRAHLALDNPRYAALLLQAYRLLLTGEWRGKSQESAAILDRPVRGFASALLAKRHKRLLRLGGAHAELSEADLHRLRLLAKKMRYAGQAFASLYSDKRTKRYLMHLGAIQEHLGSLNDAVVGRHLLVDLTRQLQSERAMPEGEVKLLEGVVLGWQSRRIAIDLADFPRTWEAFLKQKKFWSRK